MTEKPTIEELEKRIGTSEEPDILPDGSIGLKKSFIETKQAVKVLVDIIMDTVVETIGIDGHQWSDRPCSTCLAITGLIGRPFGCYWYQAKQNKKRTSREDMGLTIQDGHMI